MKPTLWLRMDSWVRDLMPFGITLLLLLCTAIPSHQPSLGGIAPMLPLMGVYYWAIYRPDLLPAWAAFLIGCLADIVGGAPLGVNALVLLLVQGIASGQRRFFLGKSFLVTWWAFGLLAAGAGAASWVLAVIYYAYPIDPTPIAFQYLLTMGLFPLLTWLLARTQTTFLKEV